VAEEVTLPQLGESVTEGTITAWLVEVGEHVDEDQPLLEISTEKIDTEVPSPASGVLQEIKADVDETIEVGEVIAIIGDETPDESGGEEPSGEEETDDTTAEADEAEADEAEADEDEEGDAAAQEQAAEQEDEAAQEAEQPAAGADEDEEPTTEQQRAPAAEGRDSSDANGQASGEMLSPIVRRLVREHDLDPSNIEGTGQGGRITREDVERAIEEGGTKTEERPAAAAPGDGQVQAGPRPRKPMEADGRSTSEDLSRVRKAIAKGMWESLQTTAQLTAGIEVDVTRIMRLRQEAKGQFKQREGVSLTPLPFFARAVCMTLQRHPVLNSAIDVEAGKAVYYQFVNLGIAVDAEMGLIVPKIKNADDLTIPALARQIADLAERTRNRQIQPDEVQGGTFTITNTGSRGVNFDTPILNPPEVGILATPKITRRPVIVEDEFGEESIAIRDMTFLCLTYDHRMVDGADAARFLTDLKDVLENHDFASELGLEPGEGPGGS
jgi:pyruvate dehydrogenase E2 component (dihydrolipoamide acetyltransferase)